MYKKYTNIILIFLEEIQKENKGEEKETSLRKCNVYFVIL
jgi:hypothetical protein